MGNKKISYLMKPNLKTGAFFSVFSYYFLFHSIIFDVNISKIILYMTILGVIGIVISFLTYLDHRKNMLNNKLSAELREDHSTFKEISWAFTFLQFILLILSIVGVISSNVN
jgi:hypothetical protein